MPIRMIAPGDLVQLDGIDYLVGEVLGNAVKLRDTGTADYRVVALEALSEAVAPTPKTVTLPGQLDEISGDQQKQIRFLAGHLEEMLTGIHPELPDRVNPLYRGNVRRSDRERTKSAELAQLGHIISPRSLRRKAGDYAPRPGIRDLAALIDGRSTRKHDPLAVIPLEFQRAIKAMLADAANQPTMTSRGHRRELIRWLTELYPDDTFALPTPDTTRRWIRIMAKGTQLRGTNQQRNSVGNRPSWIPNSRKAFMPGQEVQVDSSKFDILVRDERDNVSRATLVAMIDKCTRNICATGVYGEATNGFDLATLLARALVPRRVRRSANHFAHRDLPRMPWAKDLTEAERDEFDDRVPFIYPQRLIMDNGADYRSNVFMSACCQFGIDVSIAPPGSPTWKAIIENFFKIAMTLFAEGLPGYISNNPSNRPRKTPPVETLLTIDQLADLWDEWVIVCWQNREHEGLIDPQARNRKMTPNQAYLASYDIAAHVPLPLTRDEYIGLLPVKWRTIQPSGIAIGTRLYNSPQLAPLQHRHSGNTDEAHPGQWPVRYDPYDISVAWLQHPDTNEWIECDWMNQRWAGEPHQLFIRGQLRQIQKSAPVLDNDTASGMVLEALKVFAPNVHRAQKAKRRRNRAMEERAKTGMPVLPTKPPVSPIDVDVDYIDMDTFNPKGTSR